MRCKACDKLMSDAEIKRKDSITGEFLDLCTECAEESITALHNTLETFPTEIIIDEGVDNSDP